MDLTRKVRLYPNKAMLTILDMLCDYRRFCWNQALDVWVSLVHQRQEYLPADLRLKVKQAIKDKSVTFTDDENALLEQYPAPTQYTVRKMLTKQKHDWQYQLSSRVLYLAVADLAQAWTYFFNNKENKALRAGKPTFRQKKNPKQGFKTDRSRIRNGKLLLDKPRQYQGDWCAISFKGYSLPDGPIKYCSITKVNNKYYASRLNSLYEQIAFYQKRLARKRHVNGKKASESKSYTVMRAKLQALYEKATAIQNDLLHKFTTYLYRTYDTIVIEDLDVRAMQMSKKAKNLHRSLFGQFRFQMEYKAIKLNKQLIIADRYYPSTQRCSQCEHVKKGDDKITLQGNAKHGTAHNEYVCYNCGYTADRDQNAVNNLLALIK